MNGPLSRVSGSTFSGIGLEGFLGGAGAAFLAPPGGGGGRLASPPFFIAPAGGGPLGNGGLATGLALIFVVIGGG